MKKQVFIAYYRNAEDNQDAEIYIGHTGSNKEFINYFIMAYDIELINNDITGIYPVDKVMGKDGKEYTIGIIDKTLSKSTSNKIKITQKILKDKLNG